MNLAQLGRAQCAVHISSNVFAPEACAKRASFRAVATSSLWARLAQADGPGARRCFLTIRAVAGMELPLLHTAHELFQGAVLKTDLIDFDGEMSPDPSNPDDQYREDWARDLVEAACLDLVEGSGDDASPTSSPPDGVAAGRWGRGHR
eukprot:4761977-Alexandrium_andersonii.AAC.1